MCMKFHVIWLPWEILAVCIISLMATTGTYELGLGSTTFLFSYFLQKSIQAERPHYSKQKPPIDLKHGYYLALTEAGTTISEISAKINRKREAFESFRDASCMSEKVSRPGFSRKFSAHVEKQLVRAELSVEKTAREGPDELELDQPVSLTLYYFRKNANMRSRYNQRAPPFNEAYIIFPMESGQGQVSLNYK